MTDQAKWQALMKWTMKHTDGTTPSVATPISEDKRRFLEMVMNEGVIDETERIKDILRIMEGEDPRLVFAAADGTVATDSDDSSPEELDQYKDTLLEELLTRIDQIDNAQNFVKMGGLRVMTNVIQKYTQASSRALAAEVCSIVVQNNPICQDAAVDFGLLEVLCTLAREDNDMTCRVKALLAISCLVRHHNAAEKRFLGEICKGLDLLRQNLENATDIRLQRKSLFFLRYLMRNNRATADQVLQMDFFVQSVAAFINLKDIDLCESAVEGLAEFALVGPDYVAKCKKSEYGLIAKCKECIEQIEALEGEDKEIAQETKDRVQHLIKLLTDN
ncbi:Armadillo/beta-catenin-like repeat-containing protein [Plasmopara halstedii]|uniref:Armadillo/beta-catenin-like repeat-containing protein n=1 Tax=Plasmopara halstedii TaxID=4781 RepID=A0A0P1AAG3_PLAHL|nr:Armadillo/beta-catenin-like repeat-containing protein [Plasmopara halstedii]CEG37423.1 Armadillo/beta-catenin-like repeat-containing protein [Plasmopara halstedii]|eukprot:XP_024573792.1 Armadillo/beta-catenin-like repeat-containing protein [Plasmopara halstedii]